MGLGITLVVRRVLVAGRHAVSLGSGSPALVVVLLLCPQPAAQAVQTLPHAIMIGMIHARAAPGAGACATATQRAGRVVATRASVFLPSGRGLRPTITIGKSRSWRMTQGQRRGPRPAPGGEGAIDAPTGCVSPALACHLREPACQARMLAEQLMHTHRPAQVLVGWAGMHAPATGVPGPARSSIARLGMMCSVMIRRDGRMLRDRFVGICNAGTCRGSEQETDR